MADMTLSELKRWMDDHKTNDSWWVAIGSEVQDTLLSLLEITELKEQHSTEQISVLHQTKSGEDAEWITFKHDEDAQMSILNQAKSNAYVSAELHELAGGKSIEGVNDEKLTTVQISQELTESIQSVLGDVRNEVESLKAELAALRDLAEMLKQPLMEAQIVIEEREACLEGSESLFEMPEDQTAQQIELTQMREEQNIEVKAFGANNDMLIAI